MKAPNLAISMPANGLSKTSILGLYYQDFTEAICHFEEQYFGEFDENGIPKHGFGNSSYYNPVYVIQYGLIAHDLILKKVEPEKNKIRLNKCAIWLENEITTSNAGYFWKCNFPNKRYGLESGWSSGMYQGQGISFFLRYGQMTNQQEKYFEICKNIMNSFSLSVEQGGFKREDFYGNVWFEEYPTKKPSLVLNGYIYCLLGIYDYYRVTEDSSIKELFDDGVKTILANLPHYQTRYWSVYDQYHKELATFYYHKNIHIPLMDILFNLTGNSTFEKLSRRWNKQYQSSLNRQFVKFMYRIRPRMKKFGLL